MDLNNPYAVKECYTDDYDFLFEFTSTGPYGSILKRVIYKRVDFSDSYSRIEFEYHDQAYQLIYCDVDDYGNIVHNYDTTQESLFNRNEDQDIIVSTILSTLFRFFRYQPFSAVLFNGVSHFYLEDDLVENFWYQPISGPAYAELARFLQIKSIVVKFEGEETVLGVEELFPSNEHKVFVIHYNADN